MDRFESQRMQGEILRTLAPLASSYLEIGVQEGRSWDIVRNANPKLKRAVLCDTWGGESGGSNRGNHNHIVIPPGMDVRFLDGDSRSTVPELEEHFDLVHVDGGHSFHVAFADCVNAWYLCDKFMVVHDISMAEVWNAFCTFGAGLHSATVEVCFGGHGTSIVRRIR